MATKARGAVNAAHTAGIFADMTLDGPEIGTLVAVVDRAKNLPNRKTMGKQDPYCAMRLGKEAKKTETDKRGGQTPKWDQELRFTVHESPDYYKLKCSIFNDDKKTDLIGEAWIDLHEVIVPGGGQNDLWHQLNFKGKYAGDVRIELTYYDSRPKPEAILEKRKQREKSHSTASDVTAGSTAGSRQLGPREIKRRPLPPGPGGYSSPVSAQNTPDNRPLSSVQPDYPPDAWINRKQNNTNPPPRPPKHPIMPETPDDVGYDLQPQYSPILYDQPPSSGVSYDQNPPREGQQAQQRHAYEQRQPSNENFGDYQLDEPQYPSSDQYALSMYQSSPVQHEQIIHSNNTMNRSRDEFEPSTPVYPPQPVLNSSPYQSPPPTRTTPQSSPNLPNQQQQSWQSRGSISPTKHVVYRDSPLRQSISHNDMPSQPHGYFLPQVEDDEPPPPPPAHGGQLVRMPMPPVSYQNSQAHPTPRTPVKHTSVDERSPLQMLEYETYQGPATSTRELQNPPSSAQSYNSNLVNEYDPYHPRSGGRHNSYSNGNSGLAQDRSPVDDPGRYMQEGPQSIPQQRYSASPQEEFRQSGNYGRSPNNEHPINYGPPRRAQTFDNFEISDERQMRRSEPTVVRPRAISPNPAHTIPRKSITPTPSTPEGLNGMGTTPFGPDSYDVLNPGNSPSSQVDPYASAEQAKEAARQKEVEKLRDQGPIIGNDGRIIDPSDHLPADTWAPEPERKNRKPEHVIRIRTREEARMHHRAGSSPVSTRPHSIATSPYQPSPEAGPVSQHQAAPTPPAKIPPSPKAESPSGRNRLKKAMPTRPLPTQPYPHAQTSPAVMASNTPLNRPSPRSQRYSIGSSPPEAIQRPPLSDYQVPAGNSYTPRSGSTGLDYAMSPSPTKAPYPPPPSVADYGGYGTDESLALELSTIDIGPSRGSRTTLRSSRGYGGY